MKKIFTFFLLLIISTIQFSKTNIVFAQTGSGNPYTNKCLGQAVSTLLSDQLVGALDSLTGPLPGLNTMVTVRDPAVQTQIKGFQFDECIRAVLDGAVKLALQKVKERILDDIVDQTAAWIRGDNDNTPKFVLNYKDFLNDAETYALDNIFREIDLSTNPDKTFVNIIKEGIKRQTKEDEEGGAIAKKVNTLTNVANEIETIKKKMAQGESGFNEEESVFAALQRFGSVENPSLIKHEIDKIVEEKKQEQLKRENTYREDGLAKSTIQCQEWSLVYKASGTSASGYSGKTGGNLALNSAGKEQHITTNPRSINEPPPAPDDKTQWICRDDGSVSGETISTPSSLLRAVANKTFVEQPIDTIVTNEFDLSGIIEKIADSAFFRLQKEGLNMFNTARGSVERGLWPDNGNFLSSGTYIEQNNLEEIQTGKVIQEEINDLVKTDLQQRTTKIINSASSSIVETHALDFAPMHRIKYLDWLLNATTTPTGGILNCRLNYPSLIGILHQPYPDQIPLSSQIRPNRQTFLSTFNGIYTNAQTLLTRVLAINSQTNAETITTLKNDVLAAENTFTTESQGFGTFKIQLQSYIEATIENWPPCNRTSKAPTPEQ